MFYASQEGHKQCLHSLSNTAKADLSLGTDSGISPLMASAQCGHVDALRLILQRADERKLDRQAQDGSTAFHMAAGMFFFACDMVFRKVLYLAHYFLL